MFREQAQNLLRQCQLQTLSHNKGPAQEVLGARQRRFPFKRFSLSNEASPVQDLSGPACGQAEEAQNLLKAGRLITNFYYAERSVPQKHRKNKRTTHKTRSQKDREFLFKVFLSLEASPVQNLRPACGQAGEAQKVLKTTMFVRTQAPAQNVHRNITLYCFTQSITGAGLERTSFAGKQKKHKSCTPIVLITESPMTATTKDPRKTCSQKDPCDSGLKRFSLSHEASPVQDLSGPACGQAEEAQNLPRPIALITNPVKQPCLQQQRGPRTKRAYRKTPRILIQSVFFHSKHHRCRI